MALVLILIFGAAMVAGPIIADIVGFALSTWVQLALMGFGGFLTFVSTILLVITNLYVKTRADEAIVRTGWGGIAVIKDGGSLVIPVIHRTVPITLEELKLEVKRDGQYALLSSDKLRVDIGAEFFVKVLPDDDSIKAASRSFGVRMQDHQYVTSLVEDKLVSALRSVAAMKTLEELNSDRDSFIRQVSNGVRDDLKHNGLTLTTCTISSLDQTPTSFLKDDNIFDAQGARTIAEVTQRQLTARNILVREGEQARKDQDVQTRKRILELDQQEKSAEAQQAAEVKKIEAEQSRIALEAEIKSNREVELTAVEKAKALQVAEANKVKAIEVAKQLQLQAAEVAEQERQQAVANAEKERADAETLKALAEKEREEAQQAIETVKIVEAAERAGRQQVIEATAKADQEYVTQKKQADAEAYTIEKKAEADKAAADAKAEAITKEAEANKDAALAQATGDEANQMIPVNVNKAQVEVDKDRFTSITKPDLEARKESGKVAQDFELAQQHIKVQGEVQIARAEAAAKAWERVDVTAYTTLEEVGKVTRSLISGQSIATFANQLVDSLTPETKDAVQDTLDQVKELIPFAGGGYGNNGQVQQSSAAEGDLFSIEDDEEDEEEANR